MTIAAKIAKFLKSDTSGAVTVDFTVLTGMLVLSMAASIGTMSVGVHMTAELVQQTIEAPVSGGNGGGTGTGSGGIGN